MKKIALILAFVISLCPVVVAQTDVSLDDEFGGRFSFVVEKKLMKGLRLAIEEEVRLTDNFSSLGRLQTTVSISYKVHPNIKLGVGYALINPYDADSGDFKNCRHRFMFDASGVWRVGDWSLSLKERLQATVRTGSFNEYQAPRTSWMLKSRVKAQYKGWRTYEPYVAFELRNTLNAPTIDAYYDGTRYLTESGSRTGEAGWFLDGFNKRYVNRLRGIIGTEFRLGANSTVDVCLMGDYVIDEVVDANAEGTKLKSYTRETGYLGWIVAGYKFSF